MEHLLDPVALFRFALSERDWPLAGLLAGRLGHDAGIRPQLEREVTRSGTIGFGAPRSLGALRTLGALIRLLAGDRGAGR